VLSAPGAGNRDLIFYSHHNLLFFSVKWIALMFKNRGASAAQASKMQSAFLGERSWSTLLCLICLIVLFHGLGSAALFEPDEGRNAEKAREILLLGDWVTPHQNFLPTLDKPMFFYWLVALCFKIFGLAEWSARLPSVLSAIGCLFLVYRFARIEWGMGEALWSCLVLVTSVEFLVLSRIVIFDMTLTLFIASALMSFYAAQKVDRSTSTSLHWLTMYAAMGAATLVKGLLGLIIPSMVIFFYLLLSGKWALLSRMKLVLGVIVYLAIVAPWYAWVEVRNPGYLRYFLWEEHFVRYLTSHFRRTHNWYYFFVVVGVGFLPWSLILPVTIRSFWKRLADELNLFLALWVILPFIFFSASHSKLPHYILPVFPALALLTGRALGMEAYDSAKPGWWRFFILLIFPAVFVLYLLIGVGWPELLPVEIRPGVIQKAAVIGVYAAVFFLIFAVFALGHIKHLWKDGGAALLCTSVSLALFFVLLTQITAATSFHRASKPLAQQLATVIDPQDRLVFYNTYSEGIPFYLGINKPIWLVQAAEKGAVMGSYYVGERRPTAAAGYGPVFFTFEEFAQQWKKNDSTLRVLLREKNLPQLSADIGAVPNKVMKFDNYLLVSSR
jgi:4-amino-4-deoxy-L-arabinose transferase-like glycosyltransferase